MAAISIVYGTGEGQSAKVAETIAGTLTERGHVTHTIDVSGGPIDLEGADAVVIGSSIHFGKHHAGIVSFLEDHADRLARLPSAFFQVSLSSAVDDPDRRGEAARYVDELLEATGFEPDRIALFGGALRYSKYGLIKRAMLKRIAADVTGDTETSRDYEYTDWEAVRAFANDFGHLVEGRVGPDPGGA